MRILGPYTGLVADVAAYLGCTEVNIYKLVQSGELRCEKLGRQISFQPEHMVEYKLKQSVKQHVSRFRRNPNDDEFITYESDALFTWEQFIFPVRHVASLIKELGRDATEEEKTSFRARAEKEWERQLQIRWKSRLNDAVRMPETIAILRKEIGALRHHLWDHKSTFETRISALENSALSTLNSSLKKAAA